MTGIIYGTLYGTKLSASKRSIIRKHKNVFSEQEAKAYFEAWEEAGWNVTFNLATTDQLGNNNEVTL